MQTCKNCKWNIPREDSDDIELCSFINLSVTCDFVFSFAKTMKHLEDPLIKLKDLMTEEQERNGITCNFWDAED
jgi:hypothetical protein